MDKISFKQQNISFGCVRATKAGFSRLADSFSGNKQLLKSLIEAADKNISADILVKKEGIFVKPHPATDLAEMRMRSLGNHEGFGRFHSYYVDYSEHDVYPPMTNGYYTIKKVVFSHLPKPEKIDLVKTFGRLFDGACHIAEDIDKCYHQKVLKAIEKSKNNSAVLKETNIKIID